MEDCVDLPTGRDVKSEGYVGHYFLDFKWTSSLHLELFESSHMKIGHF